MVLIAVIVSLEEGQSERRVDPHVVGRTPSRNSEGSGPVSNVATSCIWSEYFIL